MGAHLPGADHLEAFGQSWIKENSFWTSLCFSNGRLQWLGSPDSYEERNILILEKFLPDLMAPDLIKNQMYCYHTGGDRIDQLKTSGLSLKDSQQTLGCMCVSNYRSTHELRVFTPKGQILSVSAMTEGADIDWGPVGQNRNGFINVSPSKITSLKLKCEVKTTDDAHTPAIKIRWIRNGGYVGNFPQEVSFASEEDFIPWIGLVTCEALYGNQAIRSDGFHLVAWNTVTVRLVSTCISCRLHNILETAKIILTQFVEVEISSGKGRTLKFHVEPPVIQQTYITFIMHMQNKEINKFDFQMVQKLGKQFQLSRWAKSRSLYLPNDNFELLLDTISPCNMALPNDSNNVTWVGYLGQTVTSGNFIGGPVCIDNHGDIITRSCGMPEIYPFQHQTCSTMKARQEDPQCFYGYEEVDGKCYKMTEVTSFATAVSQCWAGWPMQPEILMPDSLSNWVQTSREWIYRTQNSASSLVWLPLRRLNKASFLQTPVWSWNTVSNRWIFQTSDWNTTVETSEESALCAAYDLGKNQIISTSCQNHLPMICGRPLMPKLPQQFNLNSQLDHVGEYFCDPGWLTHWFVLDAGICYRRYTLKVAIDVDEAQEFCVQHGGHLATAPTHATRKALEEVYAYFSNRSVVDSWIGLWNRNDQPGAFRWLDESADINSSTYNWHPYSEFGNGYASAFHLGMWWNWPRNTKLWGLVCQKTMFDWQDGLSLLIEPPTDSEQEGEYAVVFTYNPKPSLREGDDKDSWPNATETRKLSHSSYLKKSFWQSDFDVVCYLRNYVRRFSFRRGFRRQYRTLVPVPTTMGSGPLTCEAWLNRPAFRFQSNTIVHRPAHWYNYVIVISQRNQLFSLLQHRQTAIKENRELLADDLLQRLNLNRFRYFREIMNNFSIVTITVEPNPSNTTGAENIFNFVVSFFVPSDVPQYDLLANARRCQPEWHFDDLKMETLEYERILHVLMQSCLPLIYKNDENYQFIEVRSTVACPPIRPLETLDHHDREEAPITIDRLAWPRTDINRMTRSISPCLIGGHMVHRTCMGNFERGAIWGTPKIRESTEIMYEATTICETPDVTNAKLYQLERMSQTALNGGLSMDAILKELLAEWEQPYLSAASLELSIDSLSHMISAYRKQTVHVNRILVTTLMEKMVRPGKSPLSELQFLPDVLNELIQLFSYLPLLDREGPRVRINLGDQVSIVADKSDPMLISQPSALTIDFNSLTVVVQKGSENAEYSNAIFTIVAVLPFDLLAVNPLTKDNVVNLYKIDASDRTRSSLLGQFISGQPIVHVNLQPILMTVPMLFTLAFKEDRDWESIPASTLFCARWDSRAIGLQGGWLTGDCWYLGINEYRRHICQCHSSGIYSLFRSARETRTLWSALIHRLPIVINIALITLVATCLVIRSACIYHKAVREMDLVEMGARLQLIMAWLMMLCCHLSQYFVQAHMVGCIVLTTLFQFFLTSAFFWQGTLLVIRRWQIHEHWIPNQNACLAKFSFAVWGLSSITILTIPIYKWKYADAKPIRSECWIEDPVDFGLTVAIICLATMVSFILNMKNICDQKEFGITPVWNAGDILAAIAMPLMALAGLFAIVDNTWLQSSSTAIVFTVASSLTGLLWLCTFWTLVARPLVKHKFQHSNAKVAGDLQLKIIYGSSIEYLNDR
ncbi:LOW QUALITY PROTEIN: uncharacterized protein LOC116920568 [Daphnia magna]|uniref:LOW QUALITY PROTEIN: uncharacterized protein LOC116920568 n=1 Tax=Daphnia magna TaxID=35525 RepID=UPI001E1BD2E6|nr:LOW QUALITY PROTEIN: uncharacterized protein LOC116920568 [Daphnia magna]